MYRFPCNTIRLDKGDSNENVVQKKWTTRWTSHQGEVWHLKGIEIREPLLKTASSGKKPKSKASAKEAYGTIEEFWVKEKPESPIEVVRATFLETGTGTKTKSPKAKGKAKKTAPKAKTPAKSKTKAKSPAKSKTKAMKAMKKA